MVLKNGKGKAGTPVSEEERSAGTLTRKKAQSSATPVTGLVKRKGNRKPSGGGRGAEKEALAQGNGKSSARLQDLKHHIADLQQLTSMLKDMDSSENLRKEAESAVLDYVSKTEAEPMKTVDSLPLVRLISESMKQTQDSNFLSVVVGIIDCCLDYMLSTTEATSNSYVDNFASRYNLLHTLNAASCYKLSLRVTMKGLAVASAWPKQQTERWLADVFENQSSAQIDRPKKIDIHLGSAASKLKNVFLGFILNFFICLPEVASDTTLTTNLMPYTGCLHSLLIGLTSNSDKDKRLRNLDIVTKKLQKLTLVLADTPQGNGQETCSLKTLLVLFVHHLHSVHAKTAIIPEFKKLCSNLEKRNAYAGFLFLESMVEDMISRDKSSDWQCLVDLWIRINHNSVASNAVNTNSNLQVLYRKLSNLPGKPGDFDHVTVIMLLMLSVASRHGAWDSNSIQEVKYDQMLSQGLKTGEPSSSLVTACEILAVECSKISRNQEIEKSTRSSICGILMLVIQGLAVSSLSNMRACLAFINLSLLGDEHTEKADECVKTICSLGGITIVHTSGIISDLKFDGKTSLTETTIRWLISFTYREGGAHFNDGDYNRALPYLRISFAFALNSLDSKSSKSVQDIVQMSKALMECYRNQGQMNNALLITVHAISQLLQHGIRANSKAIVGLSESILLRQRSFESGLSKNQEPCPELPSLSLTHELVLNYENVKILDWALASELLFIFEKEIGICGDLPSMKLLHQKTVSLLENFACRFRLIGMRVRIDYVQHGGQQISQEDEHLASEIFTDLQNMSRAAEHFIDRAEECFSVAIELLICTCLCCEIWNFGRMTEANEPIGNALSTVLRIISRANVKGTAPNSFEDDKLSIALYLSLACGDAAYFMNWTSLQASFVHCCVELSRFVGKESLSSRLIAESNLKQLWAIDGHSLEDSFGASYLDTMRQCVRKWEKSALGLYGSLKDCCINGDGVDMKCYEPFINQDSATCPIAEYNKACALCLRARAWEKRGYLANAQADVYRAYKVLGALVSKEQYSLCLLRQWQRHVNKILRRSERGWSDLFKRPSPYQVLSVYVDSLRLCSRLSQEAGDLIESMKFTNEALHVYKTWNEACIPFSILCDRANTLRKQRLLKKAHDDMVTLNAHVEHQKRLQRSVYWQVYGNLAADIQDYDIKVEEVTSSKILSDGLPCPSVCFDKALHCLVEFWERVRFSCRAEERNGENYTQNLGNSTVQKLVALVAESRELKSQALLRLLEQDCVCLASLALVSLNGLVRTTSASATDFDKDSSIAVCFLCSLADIYGGAQSEKASQQFSQASITCIRGMKYNGWLIAEVLGTYAHLLIKRSALAAGTNGGIRWPQKFVVNKRGDRSSNLGDKQRIDSILQEISRLALLHARGSPDRWRKAAMFQNFVQSTVFYKTEAARQSACAIAGLSFSSIGISYCHKASMKLLQASLPDPGLEENLKGFFSSNYLYNRMDINAVEDLEGACSESYDIGVQQVASQFDVCSLSLVGDTLILVRTLNGQAVTASTTFGKSIIWEMREILNDSQTSLSGQRASAKEDLTEAQKRKWWNNRMAIDDKLRLLMQRVQNDILGPLASFFLGGYCNEDIERILSSGAQEVCELHDMEDGLEPFLVQLALYAMLPSFNSESLLAADEGKSWILHILNAKQGSRAFNMIWTKLEERVAQILESQTELHRKPVILLIDSSLQELPWENMPCLRPQAFYRLPSLFLPEMRSSLLRNQVHMAASKDWYLTADAADADRNYAICVKSAYYLLNPGGDLQTTQRKFESFFRRQKRWHGIVGEAPKEKDILEGLISSDMFVYMGHGGGEQYVSFKELFKLKRCAPGLLMGCSSGRLHQQGDSEAWGFIIAYLLAGCSTAVANLWDVTDRDIDRFADSVLEQWTKKGPPKALGVSCVAATVGNAREKCKLSYLIGGAPVCYGLPAVICNID